MEVLLFSSELDILIVLILIAFCCVLFSYPFPIVIFRFCPENVVIKLIQEFSLLNMSLNTRVFKT